MLIWRKSELVSFERVLISAGIFRVIWVSWKTSSFWNKDFCLEQFEYLWDLHPGLHDGAILRSVIVLIQKFVNRLQNKNKFWPLWSASQQQSSSRGSMTDFFWFRNIESHKIFRGSHTKEMVCLFFFYLFTASCKPGSKIWLTFFRYKGANGGRN